MQPDRNITSADVCLVLEGTYPYVPGGVSTWVHDLIRSLPTLGFELVHIGPERRKNIRRRYALPDNVTGLSDLYCREPLPPRGVRGKDRRTVEAECRRFADPRIPSRVLQALRRLHLEEPCDAGLLQDLAANDLPVGAFLHGRASFDLFLDLYEQLAPGGSFIDLFWHYRAMHLPLVRLLGAPPPAARIYHALCTGYAGVIAAVWSQRTGRPLLLTEHGIYVRERVLELNRAAWFRSMSHDGGPARAPREIEPATAAILRRMWTRFFRALAQCAYARASRIVSISETNRTKQILDGAPPEKTHVVPNGIDVDALRARLDAAQPEGPPPRRVCVGFVGRLVPIKDVVTFIQACSLALRVVDLDVRIIGPIGEDRDYARRCHHLAAGLGLLGAVRFEGPRKLEEIYPELDMLVLTSFSEGQPLVILEAGAAGIPVISSDVGCCRELLEGASGRDRELGPSGIVTRIASSEETAAAIILLARDAALRRRLGEAGHRRVAAFYRQRDTISAYQSLYGETPWPASAGASST